MNPKAGDIWLADLGLAAKLRPVLILSRDDPDPPRVLFIYAPLTTQNRGSHYEVSLGKLPFLNEASVPTFKASLLCLGSVLSGS